MLLFSFPPSLSSFLFLPFPPYSLFFFFFFPCYYSSPPIRLLQENEALFKKGKIVHFFTDGGPHHYKSRHGILGFVLLAHEVLQKVSTTAPPKFVFHFHASHHGSDICDCIASHDKVFPLSFFFFSFFSFLFYLFYFSFPFDKRAIKKYALKTHKWISDGDDLVEALGELKGNYFSTTLEVNFFVSPIIS